MGAMLGHAHQWEKFERHLRRLQRWHHFDILHSVELKNSARRGPAEHKRVRDIVGDVAGLAAERLTEAIALTLPRQHYLDAYRNKPFPKGMRVDSQWGIAFGFCLRHMVRTIMGTPFGEDDDDRHTLHVIVEDGHRNAGAALVIFQAVKRELRLDGLDLLGDVTLAEKAERPLLMAADLVAHAFKVSHDLKRAGQPGYFERVAPGSHKPGEARQVQLFLTAENLQSLKDHYVWERKFAHEEYLRANASRPTRSIADV
jgi:hypothetical protein